MKVNVYIEESVIDKFALNCPDNTDIQTIKDDVKKRYFNCEFVIESGYVTCRKMYLKIGDQSTDWEEF